MFWRIKTKGEIKETVKETSNQLKCETCKHYIDKEDAQIIEIQLQQYFGLYYCDDGVRYEFYCPMHKKPYDKVDMRNEKKKFIKIIPEHEVEVNENGKEIKCPSKK